MSRLVLLHGWLGSPADWSAVRALLPVGTDVVAPDLPGHGDAVGLADDAYTLDGAADDLCAAMRGRWGDAPAVVAGYSMGGRLALHLAVRHPDAIGALALVAASPGLATDDERAARAAIDAERATALVAGPAAFHRAWVRLPLFATLTDDQRERIVADRLARLDPAEAARALVGLSVSRQPDHRAALARLPMPVAGVAGAADANFAAFARTLARHEIVPGAGHSLLVEAPARVAAVLSRLLRPDA